MNSKRRKGNHHPVMKLARKSSLEAVSYGGCHHGDKGWKGSHVGEGIIPAKTQRWN